jgi:hypothetical protein
VRRANVDNAAMKAAILADVLAPRLLAFAELSDSALENVVIDQAGKFRIEPRNRLKQFVGDLRLSGFLGAFLRKPTAGLQLLCDL